MTTRTFAILEIDPVAFQQIGSLLAAANYQHAFKQNPAHGSILDMHGIALAASKVEVPIPMVLTCPVCRFQHIDKPEPDRGWTNPPHKSHLCHGCGIIWRPADVATVGVEAVSRGKDDTWPFKRLTRQEREEYHVSIVISKHRYNKKIGSHARVVVDPNVRSLLIDPNVKSKFGDWSMGDWDKLEKAEAVVEHMTTIHPCNHCGARSFSDGTSSGGAELASQVKHQEPGVY